MDHEIERRLKALEQRDCSCSDSSWASELGFPILVIACCLGFYSCSLADDVKERRRAFERCATAPEMTRACELILRDKQP